MFKGENTEKAGEKNVQVAALNLKIKLKIA